MRANILVTEDDGAQRDIIAAILDEAEYDVTAVASGGEALATLRTQSTHLLLTDLKMAEMSGLELLIEAKTRYPHLEVVVMTAHASVETAVIAMKEGACDYLAKPFDKEELLVVVAKAVERAELRLQNERLRELVTDAVSRGNILGEGAAMKEVFRIVERAVPVRSTVLIYGESGTGKELIARHIHFSGPRKSKPFVVVNCAAIPDALVESELFGHEKGAFTGADAIRQGKFEVADGGTIFLDEIGDMRLESQAKLLRVLQDGVAERVGSSKTYTVDVRVIAATNRDLKKLISEGEFREDLFFRLDVLPIPVPPLRERIEDLPLLVAHFREKLSHRLGKPAPVAGPDIIDCMARYRWPGNVRELENTLEQVFLLSDAQTLSLEDLPEKLRQPPPQTEDFKLPLGGIVLEDLEQTLIEQALARSGGRIREAAEQLGLTYKTLQYRIKKHEIDRKEVSEEG